MKLSDAIGARNPAIIYMAVVCTSSGTPMHSSTDTLRRAFVPACSIGVHMHGHAHARSARMGVQAFTIVGGGRVGNALHQMGTSEDVRSLLIACTPGCFLRPVRPFDNIYWLMHISACHLCHVEHKLC